MGIIDKKSVTLTCTNCGAKETIKAVESGSQYGGSWGDFSSPQSFIVTTEMDKFGPNVTDALCKSCQIQVAVEHS